MGVGSLLLTAVVALIGYLFLRLRRNMQHWQNLGIPCEEPYYLMGNLAGVRTKRAFPDIWIHYYNKFRGTGPFAGFYWFQRPAAFILEPFLVKHILIKDFNKFTDRGFFHNPEDDPLSGQLFLLDGHKWRSMRNKLSSTFTSGKMKFMFPTIVKIGHEFVDVFGEMTAKSSIIEVKELMARFTTDVIGTCAFGIECSSLKDPEAEFRVMGRKALTDQRHGALGIAFLNSFPNLSRRIHLKMTPEYIEKFFMRIVRETVAYREENNVRRNDFMDQLIDLKNNQLMKSETGESMSLTIEEIAAQAFVFFAAGFETSSTTMGFALFELAQNEDIQTRLREECNEVLARYNGELTYECIKDMEYLNQVISETLRLYTVLPVLNRECLEDFVVPGYPNYVIKKGMPVLIPCGAMHRDEKFYPEPNRFNPDNFKAERVKNRDSGEWLPFGDGPRNCIGMRFGEMQARVGLAMLIKNFKFSVCDKTIIPIKNHKESFLIASESGIYLKVERVQA
ncbi:probable cytochrome P450 6a21 [Drosophila novamexicana]|uniref:probable cytochrome P450 6a21 n=1 Tax=Drosophila novamexicana TaxID=47314 RepID=UPI0011E601D2|nr:probable cytochrome P450 6a21 [Drosophila novamexicana]